MKYDLKRVSREDLEKLADCMLGAKDWGDVVAGIAIQARVKTRTELGEELLARVKSGHGAPSARCVTLNIDGSTEQFIRILTDYLNAPKE